MATYKNNKYYFQYSKNGEYYRGTCHGCFDEESAKLYEDTHRQLVEALAAQRAEEGLAQVKKEYYEAGHLSVKDIDRVYEKFYKQLTYRQGYRDILLRDAFAVASEFMGNDKGQQQSKKSVFDDFVSYMRQKYPQCTKVRDVTAAHANSYISYVKANGRFEKNVTYWYRGKERTRQNKINALSGRTLVHHISVCNEIFNLLADEAGISKSPFVSVKKPPLLQEKRDIFTPEEVKLLLKQTEHELYPIILLALTTGLRNGDICCLKRGDVNIKTNCIERLTNKTSKKVCIPLAPMAADYLGKALNASSGNASSSVFPALEKQYKKDRSGLSKKFKRLLAQLGIESSRANPKRSRKVSTKDIHSMRHTFSTLAMEAGIPLNSIQAMMGHQSMSMTLHYANHSSDEQLKTNMTRFWSTSFSDLNVFQSDKSYAVEQGTLW